MSTPVAAPRKDKKSQRTASASPTERLGLRVPADVKERI